MSNREKLVELLGEFNLFPSKMKNVWMAAAIEKLADHLISNGVTVRKPINTNADCIRNMNDDVLVVAISQMIIKEVESALRSEGKVPTATGLAFLCAGVRDHAEMWLRQECE